MKRKKIVVALGHKALGTTLPEQKAAVKRSAKVIADLVAAGADVVITHSNAPQVGMIHMAMNEFGKTHTDYSAAPMSVCSAMSEGYIGYDLQNAIRAELLRRGIFKTTSTILTQVEVDPYDDAFNNPVKLIGRTLTKEEADAEEEKGNYVTKTEDGYRRIVAAPKPQDIVEIDSIRLLLDAGQVVIAERGVAVAVLLEGVGEAVAADVLLTGGVVAGGADVEHLVVAVGDVLGAGEHGGAVRGQGRANVDGGAGRGAHTAQAQGQRQNQRQQSLHVLHKRYHPFGI